MRLSKLFKSIGFRLTLLYVTLFEASVIILMLFVYFTTVSELEGQTRYAIQTEAMELKANFISQKMPKTIAVIKNKIAQDTDNTAVYLLADKSKKVLAGNLENLPLENLTLENLPGDETEASRKPNTETKWLTYNIQLNSSGGNKSTRGIAYQVNLPKGYVLVVGHNLKHLEKIQELISKVIAISVVLSGLLAIGSGVLMSKTLTRRIEAINITSSKIIAGNLSERIVVGGSGDEFDHLAENLNAMLSRIEELVYGIKQVSDNIAHDLRTPLNRIRNRLESLIINTPNREEIFDELRVTLSKIDKLVSTFNAILQISQIEAGAATAAFGDFDMSEVISSMVEFYEPLADEKNQEVESDIQEGIAYHGDAHLIMQAFANLIDNAVKYTPAGGKVTVQLKQEEGQITLTVADSGPGIPPEFYDKVVERFFRMEGSRTSKGSGLGLSLVKAAALLHKARLVFADNSPGLKVSLIFGLS